MYTNQVPEWVTPEALQVLQRGYLLPGEGVKDAIARIAHAAASRLQQPAMEERFFQAIWDGHLCLATPIWTNMGTDRGLPISCFGSYVPDSIAGIASRIAEVMMMSKMGGGTSLYMGHVRGRGAPVRDNGHSNGVMPFLQMFDTVISGTNQGNTRRGSLAAYLDITHPDAEEFLDIKDVGSALQQINMGVCVSDDFIAAVKDGDGPSRELWAKVIKARVERGVPYLLFTDNVNRQRPDCYQAADARIFSSNLCNEIMLPCNAQESFVCCLSSLNLARYQEWKDTDLVRTAIYFLDAVMQEFIDKAADMPHMQHAHRFASRHRALGLGVLGWHSFLQGQGLPFVSPEADAYTEQIFGQLQQQSLQASRELAQAYGEPECCEGFGRRNTTLLAIAPTTTNALVAGGYSNGIEPLASNYFVSDGAKGSFARKNPMLLQLLERKGLNTPDVWQQILADGGSVQQLPELSFQEKQVFLTFKEIDQQGLVRQAALRQRYLDQGQSLNLNFPPATPAREINAVLLLAHELGLKGLYYQRSESILRQQMQCDLLQGCRTCEA